MVEQRVWEAVVHIMDEAVHPTDGPSRGLFVYYVRVQMLMRSAVRGPMVFLKCRAA